MKPYWKTNKSPFSWSSPHPRASFISQKTLWSKFPSRGWPRNRWFSVASTKCSRSRNRVSCTIQCDPRATLLIERLKSTSWSPGRRGRFGISKREIGLITSGAGSFEVSSKWLKRGTNFEGLSHWRFKCRISQITSEMTDFICSPNPQDITRTFYHQ